MFRCNSSVRFSATKCYCICAEKWRRVTSSLLRPLDQIYNKKTDTEAFYQTCSETKQTRKSSHFHDEMTKLIIFLTNPPQVHIYHPGGTVTYSLKETIAWVGLFSPLMSLPSSRAHTVNPLPAAPLPQPSQPACHRKPVWNNTCKCQKALGRLNQTQYNLGE